MTMHQFGDIRLEGGALVGYRDGQEVGRMFVGRDTWVFRGELTIFQEADPPKLRFCSIYPDWHGYMGAISFNVLRDDERQEEVALFLGGVAEDAQHGDLRGQFEMRVSHTPEGSDTKIVFVGTSAYSPELFGEQKLWIGLNNPQPDLRKFA